MQITPIEREIRMIRLTKNGHEFRLCYQQGEEHQVLAALTEMVQRRDLPFDWFDAAVMSHQLGEHLSKELQGFVPKNAA
jgi:hypothetical protein